MPKTRIRARLLCCRGKRNNRKWALWIVFWVWQGFPIRSDLKSTALTLAKCPWYAFRRALTGTCSDRYMSKSEKGEHVKQRWISNNKNSCPKYIVRRSPCGRGTWWISLYLAVKSDLRATSGTGCRVAACWSFFSDSESDSGAKAWCQCLFKDIWTHALKVQETWQETLLRRSASGDCEWVHHGGQRKCQRGGDRGRQVVKYGDAWQNSLAQNLCKQPHLVSQNLLK